MSRDPHCVTDKKAKEDPEIVFFLLHHRLMSSLGMQHNTLEPVSELWFEALPIDVIPRIAVFLKATRDYPSIISLAKASSTLRAPLQRTFAHKLDGNDVLDASESGDFATSDSTVPRLCADLVDVLGVQQVHHITSSELYPAFITCFKSPHLNSLSTLDLTTRAADHLAFSTSLRALELQFNDFQEYGGYTSLSRLSSLDIRHFKLEILRTPCLHHLFSQHPSNHSLLARWFPRVEKLCLACAPCTTYLDFPPNVGNPLWNVIKHFSNLQELELTEDVSEDAIQALRNIPRIVLRDDSLVLANQIPHHVVGISSTQTWYLAGEPFCLGGISEDLFEQFARCPNLKYLHCSIDPGTERHLSTLAANLHSLRIAFQGEESDMRPLPQNPVLYEPVRDAFLQAVLAAPYLTSLRVHHMRIRPPELREILTVLGERLEEFEQETFPTYFCGKIDFCGKIFQYPVDQTQYELEEVIKTLEVAARCNTSLKTFKFQVRAHWFQDKTVVLAMLPRLEASVGILQRYAPQLYGGDLRWMLRDFHKYCSDGSGSDSERCGFS